MTARDAAMEEAGRMLAAMTRDRDLLAAAEGPDAAGREAHYPGHPLTGTEIAAELGRLQDLARRKAAA